MNRLTRRFLRSRRGAVAIFVAAAAVPLVAMIGLAVDGARGYLVRARLSQALDSAALAGGRVALSPNRDADINMYFAANFPDQFLGADVGTPNINVDQNAQFITVTASATVGTTFMRVLGFEDITVNVRTVVRRDARGMELVLVMDNTGSMASNNKIGKMKTAATDLVNILYGDNETLPNFWVGLVPYVATVNIGAQHTDWVNLTSPPPKAVASMTRSSSTITVNTVQPHGYKHQDLVTIAGATQTAYNGKYPIVVVDADTFTVRLKNGVGSPSSPATGTITVDKPVSYAPGQWKGCVEARPTPFEEAEAEALPSAQPFNRFFWNSTLNVEFRNNDGDLVTGDNNWPTINETIAAGNNAAGPNLQCPDPITSLQPSKTTALNAIASMGAWSRGGTMGNLGLAWASRVLSPSWRGLWEQSPANLPLDYGTPLMEKVVVMLTDGNNEWFDMPGRAPGCSGVSDCPNTLQGLRNADYTAYGRLAEGRVSGLTDAGPATAEINNRMTSLCTAMKQRGIIIYTIVVQVNNSTTQNLYRNCATQPDYFFVSPTGDDLSSIFSQIATQLSNLRLAQ